MHPNEISASVLIAANSVFAAPSVQRLWLNGSVSFLGHPIKKLNRPDGAPLSGISKVMLLFPEGGTGGAGGGGLMLGG